jgi:phytoene synthase
MLHPDIDTAYEYCESVTRNHAKSFYFAAKFLPKHKQKAVFAVYAFCRHVDDEVDESGFDTEEQATDAVKIWKERLDRVYEGAATAASGVSEAAPDSRELALENVFTAWKDILREYPIPRQAALDLIKGVLMDTYKKRYENFEDLYLYCYRVASTVGLMSSEILGYSDRKALEYAEALGVAMQMTNILRDVNEDAAMGRIYLPITELSEFGVTEEQIFDRRCDGNFRRMMKFQIERARGLYAEGEKGIAYLEKETRFTVLFASRIYARILEQIELLSYDVFSQRAHTTKRQKLLAMPSVWLEARRMKGSSASGE